LFPAADAERRLRQERVVTSKLSQRTSYQLPQTQLIPTGIADNHPPRLLTPPDYRKD
jgi:hypothetical protein